MVLDGLAQVAGHIKKMTYISLVLYCFHLNGSICMKICVSCGNEFKPSAADIACSIRCKILSSITKNENGCWIWNRKNIGARYGKLRWNKKWISSHRASYELFKGPIEIGKIICHKCDVTLCVNPDHLFVGTHKQNINDAINKKRLIIGAHSLAPKFTDDQVEEMRKLKSEGFTYSRLRRIFNCTDQYLVKVVKNTIRRSYGVE